MFVHELGHFVVAKLCGVRVLKFSLGFGSALGIGSYRLRWERSGTEYVVAWIPLGGYVKMLGEQLHDAGEDEPPVPDARPDEYMSAKPVWQKLCISFAGPAMNLLLPVVIFMGVFAWGVPQPVAVVGTVERPSPAAEAGLLRHGIVKVKLTRACDLEKSQALDDLAWATGAETVQRVGKTAVLYRRDVTLDPPVKRGGRR